MQEIVIATGDVVRSKVIGWRLVDLTVASSNLFIDWIREADALRRAAA